MSAARNWLPRVMARVATINGSSTSRKTRPYKPGGGISPFNASKYRLMWVSTDTDKLSAGTDVSGTSAESSASTASPEIIVSSCNTTNRRTRFSSSRTFPGQCQLFSTFNASGEKLLVGNASAWVCARKCVTSGATSSARSRNGGKRNGTTLRR